MAYQPKYAQKKPDRPQKVVQPRQEPKKKMSKGVFALFIVLGIIIIPAASFLTGKLLLAMAQDLGRPKAAAVAKTADLSVMADLEMSVCVSQSVRSLCSDYGGVLYWL